MKGSSRKYVAGYFILIIKIIVNMYLNRVKQEYNKLTTEQHINIYKLPSNMFTEYIEKHIAYNNKNTT